MLEILIILCVGVWFFLAVSACIYPRRQRRGVYSPLVTPDMSNVFPLKSRVLTPSSCSDDILSLNEVCTSSLPSDGQPYYVMPSSEPVPLSEEGQRFMEGLMMMARAGITLGSPLQPIERERWMPNMQAMLAQGIITEEEARQAILQDEHTDIDYEQPQTMYPELPEMEYES